jgi:heme oxygenase
MTPSALQLALRTAIADQHTRIEATAIAVQITAGSVAPDDYVRLLRRLLPLHRHLDALVLAASAGMPSRLLRRSDAIAADLAVLVPHEKIVENTPQHLAIDGQAGILGALYVVAGSRLGSRVLRPALATALGRSPASGTPGLTYHDDYPAMPADWQSFLQRLAAISADDHPAEYAAAIRGAHAAMAAFLEIYTAASPTPLPLAKGA